MSRTEYFKNHVKYFIDVHKKFAGYSHSDRRDFAWMVAFFLKNAVLIFFIKAEVAQWNGGLMNAHGIYLGCLLNLGTPEQIETYKIQKLQYSNITLHYFY